MTCKNPIGHTSCMKLFHANLSSAKRLTASHSNPMSNSFIFILEINVVCCLPLDFFVCLRECWSAILTGGVIWKTKKMTKPAKFSPRYYLRPRNLSCDGIGSITGGDIQTFDVKNHNSQQPSLERVYCVFQCFRQCPGLAIVQKYTAYITAEGAHFYFHAYVSEENLFHQVHDIHCKYFSSLYMLLSI